MRTCFKKKVVEKIKTRILCSVTFFPENRTVYEIIPKKYGAERVATNDVTIWRIRVACWISKVIFTYAHSHARAPGYTHTHTHTNCFPTATMILERASLLRYTYIVRLVILVSASPNKVRIALYPQKTKSFRFLPLPSHFIITIAHHSTLCSFSSWQPGSINYK